MRSDVRNQANDAGLKMTVAVSMKKSVEAQRRPNRTSHLRIKESSHFKGTWEALQETLGHRPAQCSCCATDRNDRHDCPGFKAEGAQVLICKHCESKHWMDHKLVIPIKSERSVQYKTASVEASRQASPPCLRVGKL